MNFIDKDILLQRINTQFWSEIENIINSAPSIEIVRCKDCKYWVQEGNESFGYAMFCNHDCSLGGQGIKNPDGFCNYGEVRDERV
jgi:hypothetical protein